jgi:hypothetical protein
MAVYWHPLLAQFLRWHYGDRLRIEEEVPLGEMPPRLDILFIRREREGELPYPFNHLGPTTIVEYKGPLDAAGHADLVKLEAYALLYQWQEDEWKRSELTL